MHGMKSIKNKVLISQKGFTLIEMLIVVAVIGILSAISYRYYNKYKINAEFSRMESQLRETMLAVNKYRAEFGIYPGGNNTVVCNNLNNKTTLSCNLGNNFRHTVGPALEVRIRSDNVQGTYIIRVTTSAIPNGGTIWVNAPANEKNINCNIPRLPSCNHTSIPNI